MPLHSSPALHWSRSIASGATWRGIRNIRPGSASRGLSGSAILKPCDCGRPTCLLNTRRPRPTLPLVQRAYGKSGSMAPLSLFETVGGRRNHMFTYSGVAVFSATGACQSGRPHLYRFRVLTRCGSGGREYISGETYIEKARMTTSSLQPTAAGASASAGCG